jgi:hypothetical protein
MFKSCPYTGRKYKGDEYSRDRIGELLSLVDVEIPGELIDAWSQEQIMEAGDWATRSYLRASDNNVRVPERPNFL